MEKILSDLRGLNIKEFTELIAKKRDKQWFAKVKKLKESFYIQTDYSQKDIDRVVDKIFGEDLTQ